MAILTGPVAIAIAAITALIVIGVLLWKNWDKISGFFENLKNTIKQKLKDMFNFELPHIKLPHFNLKGSFSIMPPSVPKLDVSWYDKGGIFNRPSIIGIGEKREEFVGTLDDLKYLIRDELLKNSSNGGTQIIFQGNYSSSILSY